MNLDDEGLRLLAASSIANHRHGHAHFWERALTRRQFLVASGLAGGAAVTSSVWMPLVAEASTATVGPIPIPYGTMVGGKLFHFKPPVTGLDQSTIYDFKGVVGVAEISGRGNGIHNGMPIANAHFGSDNRFMKGVFKGTDGNLHHGTFGFI